MPLLPADLLPPSFRRERQVNWECGERDIYVQLLAQTKDKHMSPDWDLLRVVEGEEERVDENAPPPHGCFVRLFGVSEQGYSCCLTLRDYYPYFYMLVPDHWTPSHHQQYIDQLNERVSWSEQRGFAGWTHVQKKELYGFKNGKTSSFLQLSFRNTWALKKYLCVASDAWFRKTVLQRGTVKYEEQEYMLVPAEHNLDFFMNVLHDYLLTPCGWLKLSAGSYEMIPPDCPASLCELDLHCSVSALQPLPEREDIAPLTIVAFDGEMMSRKNRGSFPLASNVEDPVFQISIVAVHYGRPQEEPFKVVLCYRETAPIAECRIVWFASEYDLLQAFHQLWQALLPDVVTGYNIFGFDEKYLWQRYQLHSLEDKLNFSKLVGYKSKLLDPELQTRAHGAQQFYLFSTPGIIQLDLLHLVRKSEKLKSYKLDDVAEEFLGEKKLPVTPQDIFRWFEGTPEDRAKCARYCLWDSWLCKLLLEAPKLMFLENLICMSRVSFVFMDALMMRGQSVKVVSQLTRVAHEFGFLMTPPPNHPLLTVLEPGTPIPPQFLPQATAGASQGGGGISAYFSHVEVEEDQDEEEDMEEEQDDMEVAEEEEELPVVAPLAVLQPQKDRAKKDQKKNPKLQGATVLTPKSGYYVKPVSFLDFQSLYPSIIQAHNFCFSTLLLDDAYDNLPDVKYDSLVSLELPFPLRARIQYKFALSTRGVVPRVLDTLLQQRAATKKQIAEIFAHLQENRQLPAERVKELKQKAVMLDGKQNALKISANSVYGWAGRALANGNKFPCLAISAAVTWNGRLMIEATKQHLVSNYPGSDVIYGDTDSCMVIFPSPPEASEKEQLANAFTLMKEAAVQITAKFPPPVKLTPEKVHFPYLLVGKKRYAGVEYLHPEREGSLKVKGIQYVRRDSCALVHQVCKGILEALFFERSKERAVQDLEQRLMKLARGEVPHEDLVISRSLSKSDYKGKTPHVLLAERVAKRDPGNAFKPGDRVPFLVHLGTSSGGAFKLLAGKRKQSKSSGEDIGERVELPDVVKEKKLEVDAMYYMQSQLSNPVHTLLDLVSPQEVEAVMQRVHSEIVRRRLKVSPISSFFRRADK